ncbi:MAG TPA: hypothetical protein VF806_01255 [Anaerolineaceae bacterium]
MANVRCPMCSRLNPPDAETCSFCGARLKPVDAASSTPVPGAGAGQSGEEEEPDWLRSLRSGPEEPPAGEESHGDAPKPDEVGGSVPDWLSRIRERTHTEPADEPTQAAGNDQDWLSDLQPRPADEQASDMDWLNRLPGEQPGAEQPSEPAQKGEGEILPADWMGALPQEPPAAAQPEGRGEGEDWMSQLSAWQPTGSEEGKPEEPNEVPTAEKGEGGDFDWLESFSREQPGSEPVVPAADTNDVSMDNLLLTLNELPAEQPAQPGETPLQDWGESAASTPQSDLPEWLNELPQAEQKPSGSGEETGLPEWLQGAEKLPGPSEQAAKSEPPASELPAWLFEGTIQPVEEPAQPAPAESSSEGQLPSLFSSQEEEKPGIENPEEEQPAPEASASMDIPDWLSEFGAGKAQNEPAGASEGEGIGASAALEGAASEIPSNVEQVSAEQPEPAATAVPGEQVEPPAPETTPAPAEESPEWLREFDLQAPSGASTPPLIEEEAQAHPLEGDQPFAVELPDWLQEEAEQKAGEESEQPAELAGEPLAQAELPEWVKEMRPIESIIPGEAQMAETERKAEKTGPLAGLAGILPAEELVSRYRKPPVYSVKLRVSEKQRGQASQLDNILAQETQPLLIPPQGKGAQSVVLRAIIALVLIVVLAAPRLLQLAPIALPALYPVETQKMYEQLENDLPADVPVLLAVDYEPALAGEMRLASTPVIEHLMAKNAHIVIVSTRATGAALAEQLLTSAAERHPGYDLSKMTVNLGYLPGDMISLQEFARQPAFAAPGNLSGEQAWQGATLKGFGKNITSIQDFSRVIVLTDTAEIGRAWVEQVQAQMGKVPLLMVTSAQAAPMMTPFVESNQVNGMVSGLLGGIMYAQWAKQASPVTTFLATYQVGIALAFALVVVGGLISGGMAMLKRGGRDEE